MSTSLLQELQQEVRRLYIAGSELAVGDFRLKRLLPQFQQLGERAPVFKRLAEGIAMLLEPSSQQTGTSTSADKLQDLSLLLNSVLRTQGSTSPDGELIALKNRPLTLTTSLPFRKLAEVQDALTSTGGGRFEIIVQAFEAGMFQDVRLLNDAFAALHDPYIEIAEFARTHILPSYGAQIAPHLIEAFDPTGGKVEARRLKVIGQLGGEAVTELIFQAAESGTEDVRVAAIELLSGHEPYEEALVGWTKDRKKTIREAAYYALAEGGSARAVERIYEAFSGKDVEIASRAAAKCDHSELTSKLIGDLNSELKQTSELLADKTKLEASRVRVRHYLNALDGKRSQALYDVYEYATNHYELYQSLGWSDLFDEAAYYLENTNTEAALALLHQLEQHSVLYMPHAFRLSFRLLTPEQLYKRYVQSMHSKWKLRKGKDLTQRTKELISTIEQLIISHEYKLYPTLWSNPNETTSLTYINVPPIEQLASEWDERWLDWFIEQDASALVCAFARPDHAGCRRYLVSKSSKKDAKLNTTSREMLLRGLERAGANDDDQWEALMVVLESSRYSYEGYTLEKLYQLPSSYCDRLATILLGTRYTSAEILRYVIEQMRAATGVNNEL